MTTRRVLVTGGAGFIGHHLSVALLDRGDEVTVLDDLSGGDADNVDDRAEFLRGSVVDVVAVERAFGGRRYDVVYHLAAYAAEGLSHFIKRFNYTNNVVGSMNVINAAVNQRAGHLVFTSSAAVYGEAQSTMDEAQPCEPMDSYGIAKLAVEQDLVASERMFGLPFTVFRPHNVYGERQNIADRYRNVIAIFMNTILSGQPMRIFGDGEQTRAFTHVSSILPALLDAPDLPGARNQVFNIGSDDAYTIRRLADIVRKAMGKPDHPIIHEPPRVEAAVVGPRHAKAVSVFGRSTGPSLEEGVHGMAAWAKKVGAQQPSTFGGIEIAKNLPPSWRV